MNRYEIETMYNTILIKHAQKRSHSLSFKGTKLLPQSIPLKQLYIDLGFQADLMGLPERGGIGRASLKELITQHNSVTILGGSGSGKSTFVKYILNQFFSESNSEVLNKWPFCVSMNDYIKKCTEERLKFTDYLYAEIVQIVGLHDDVKGWFQDTLSTGGAFLIIEDLDVAAFHTEAMTFALKSLEDFLNSIIPLGNKVLLTSRIIGYEEVRLNLSQSHMECYISGFNDDDIIQFSNNWSQIITTNEEQRKKCCFDLLDLISSSQWNREMSSNPSILTRLAIISLNSNGKKLSQMETIELILNGLIRGGEIFRGSEGLVNKLRNSNLILQTLGPLALDDCISEGDSFGFYAHELTTKINYINHPSLNQIEIPLNVHLHDPFCLLFRELKNERLTILFQAFRYYIAGYSLSDVLLEDGQKAYSILVSMINADNLFSVALAITSAVLIASRNGTDVNTMLKNIESFDKEGLGIGPLLCGFVLSENSKIARGYKEAERTKQRLLDILTCKYGQSNPKIRSWAGEVVAKLNDPRKEVTTIDSMHFCEVKAGDYFLNSNDEKPSSILYDYYMGKFPITWSQFNVFARNECYQNRKYYPNECDSWFFDKEAHSIPFFNNILLNENQPAIAITWFEAYAFCKWLNELAHKNNWLNSNWEIRLPLEEEWVKAARGGQSIPKNPVVYKLNEFKSHIHSSEKEHDTNPNSRRSYTWEDNQSIPECPIGIFGINGSSPVGAFPNSVSPYGCEEMIGNVWEWLSTEWGEDWEHPTRTPYSKDSKVEQMAMMVKGGSFLVSDKEYSQESRKHLAIDYLTKNHSDVRHVTHGFRICIAPKNQASLSTKVGQQ
ncbi:SUMF1/EgtB/PvdO family nonheme iron enzyme [Bacillus sp. ISL-18]|uniref:SUMF1/EgtB/PvdO family nonheme iron enzyme n=1 Tax=Bacillus sp. ISL-18 TaxID=2819118 RepID=UPI001BE68B8A|nr:SUMF1/EgtB/PvdO family nonheme iron enzyme [Bacillus sp. ISL-18]MBT2657631.1 SUMF1/EgtB/PvdO family nonheme iron enzyme [Bacillus sp. ISL-18]